MYLIHMFSWGYFLKSILQQFQCTCILMQNVLQYCVPVFITVVNLIFLIDLVFTVSTSLSRKQIFHYEPFLSKNFNRPMELSNPLR